MIQGRRRVPSPPVLSPSFKPRRKAGLIFCGIFAGRDRTAKGGAHRLVSWLRDYPVPRMAANCGHCARLREISANARLHIGPEPCGCVRKEAAEASVGEGTGQPLSRESLNPGADAVSSAEGNT